MNQSILSALIFLVVCCSCGAQEQRDAAYITPAAPLLKPVTGAAQVNSYLPLLEGKRVGMVVNQTSMVGETHLVDTLIAHGVEVLRIFAPEHGFRGNIDRGATVVDGKDEATGLPVVSLYGKNKKPSPEQLADLDILLFDIQDVGVRFFTYISTMHYVMEACAENKKPLLILDRPNPNGHIVDGPVRADSLRSFVGLDPLPVLHGCTVAELAQMINAEGWLEGGVQCVLQVQPMAHYTHTTPYSLPVRPSPNLPNDQSVGLYASLAFFEASQWSVGRGTDWPFQVLGAPDSTFGDFSFVPEDRPGVQMNPVQEGTRCYGLDLRAVVLPDKLDLSYLRRAMVHEPEVISNPRWFHLLSGDARLLDQLQEGRSEEEIRTSWEPELSDFKKIREKYLMYPGR